MIIEYFIFGLGFYTGVAILKRDTYKDASFGSVARGLIFGVLLWPIAMYVILSDD